MRKPEKKFTIFKSLHLIESRLNDKFGKHCEVVIINLINEELHLWDEDFPHSSDKWVNNRPPLSNKLATADAFIIASPKWGGMAPVI